MKILPFKFMAVKHAPPQNVPKKLSSKIFSVPKEIFRCRKTDKPLPIKTRRLKRIYKKKKKTVIIFLSNQKKYAKETVLFHLPIQNKKLCRSPKQDKKKEAYP